MGWASAVAASLNLGFASDVVDLRETPEGFICEREMYGGKVRAEIDFPNNEAIVLLLRRGVWAPTPQGDHLPYVSRVAPDVAVRSTTYVSTVEATTDDVDITNADVILSIGRGVDDREELARFESLAEQLGATLAFSRPLIDAGWAPASRQVGQSGKTVKPRVYIALGISGAIQHLAGMNKSGTIVAVNTDPDAPIFRAAHYRATIDLFDVVDELEQLSQ
jgi:electron transfer flavoprotein alpha subunit